MLKYGINILSILKKESYKFNYLRSLYHNDNKLFSSQIIHEKNSLQNYLVSQIKMKGPITVAEFMKEVLGNPKWGYYMKKDVFGSEGDFITAPEISQIFGELVGVWFLNEWIILKTIYENDLPESIQLIEMGPGKGTLMNDVLRVWSKSKFCPKEIRVYMIETSSFMRKKQMRTLCDLDLEPNLYESYKSKYGDSIQINWLSDINELPHHNVVHFFLANEFFDALPFQKFQKNSDGNYREILVDFNKASNKLEFVMSNRSTMGSQMILNLNPSYRKFDHVEVSSESARYIEIITKRLHKYNGSMLIIDYGHNGVCRDTFRAFKNHKIVENVFHDLGECDLTVDVDFAFLKYIAQCSKGVCYGPILQSKFLTEMKIEIRLKNLLKSCKTEADKSKLIHDYNFLMKPENMGEKFKVLALRKLDFKQPPPGFS